MYNILMKWNARDYIELMMFGHTDRPMFVELFGPLIGLEDEWRTQGATPEEIDLTAFDFDYVNVLSCGGTTGLFRGVMPRVLEETDQHIISIDTYGRKTRLCKGFATIALPMDYPVKDMDSWLAIKHWFEYSSDRINWEQVKVAQKARKEGHLVLAGIPGGFDLPRQLMGEEATCLCYYDQPELMEDILDTIGETSYRVLDEISNYVVIDNLSVHEDMAGKSGPLVGPSLVNAFIKPYYRRIWDMLSSKGTRLFSQDSDGNMNAVIEAFLDCGVNIMFPVEPAAGMDMVKLREKYGKRLAFKGGIDKHVLRKDKDAIRQELEYKLSPSMQKGGIVFGLDHRITNLTSIDHYRYYVKTARELLGFPSLTEKTGWQRMAF